MNFIIFFIKFMNISFSENFLFSFSETFSLYFSIFKAKNLHRKNYVKFDQKTGQINKTQKKQTKNYEVQQKERKYLFRIICKVGHLDKCMNENIIRYSLVYVILKMHE